MSQGKITFIRASSLPHYSDCTRRSAAKMFSKELHEYGFELVQTNLSIGAAVGTATHKALETALVLKKDGKEYVQAMRDVAAESLKESISCGIIWDDTTTNKDAGILQAVRQARVVLDFMPSMKHIEIEGEFTANLSDGFTLSGHIDLRGTEEAAIWDLKTGTRQRVNIAQYGAYSLLARSNGHAVKEIGEIYVPRVGISKPQPDPTIVKYPVSNAETIAFRTIQRIKEDITHFRETDGDPWVWLPNPNSMMCSPDYCPAFGTNFCDSHMKGK